MPIRPPVYSRARRPAGLIRPWKAGTSGNLAGEDASLAARITGPVPLLTARRKSAAAGQSPVFRPPLTKSGRACPCPHSRRPPTPGMRDPAAPVASSPSGSGGEPDEPPSPAADEAEAASDQRRSRDSYLPCFRPFRNSSRIEGSLISRSTSVAARPSISCTVEPGWSRKACSTKRGTEPLGARLLPPARRFGAAAAGLPRLGPAGDARSLSAPRISSNSLLASDWPRA